MIKLQITEGEVYGFKLATGEEVIARLVTKERTEYVITQPFQTMVSQQGVALAPWPMISEERAQLGIPIAHIVTVFPPRKEYADYYKEETSTIIQPAKQGIIQ